MINFFPPGKIMIRCCITCSFLDEAAFKLQPVAMINESAELEKNCGGVAM